MARPYWSGQIQISLVSFGVNLFVATEARSDIHFHQIDRNSGERVKHQKVLASDLERDPEDAADPVAKSSIVKGYEYSRNQYITLEPDDLAHLRIPSKHTIQVTQFIDESSIDPAFYEKPYFVVPENEAQTEAFLTVRKALIDTKKVALSKIAFAGREHIVAIAPAGTEAHPGLMAYTLRYAAELRDPADYFRDIKKMSIAPDSLSLAKELIHRKAAKFDPSRFVDDYEVAVKELVDAKLKHLPIPRDEAPTPRRAKVINLMDALRKSVSGNTKSSTTKPQSIPKPARKPATKKGPTLVKTPSKSTKPEARSTRSTRRKTA